MIDVSCVINAHREAHVIHPTIVSVKRAIDYARGCGLVVDLHVVLDRPDERTINVVQRNLEGEGEVHTVAFGDLANSRNHAVKQVSGKYVAFVDGDDLWSQNWIVSSFQVAEVSEGDAVFHPEYNIYFGNTWRHVFHHVDMASDDFEIEALLRSNYWTALSFARNELYKRFPYRENTIRHGFGYEDWTWNCETIKAGIVHRIVPGTAHYIRKGKSGESLLAQTNTMKAIPRVLDIYCDKAPGGILKSVA
jgi:glycosyltransferase involved in cell wall biosynthesis